MSFSARSEAGNRLLLYLGAENATGVRARHILDVRENALK